MAENSINDKLLAGSTTFTGRLQVLLCRYAQVVAVGAYSAASKNLAARVMSDPGNMSGKIAVSLVSDGGVSGSYAAGDSTKTDAELDGVIQAVWASGKWDHIV